jgi:hypothetical protein
LLSFKIGIIIEILCLDTDCNYHNMKKLKDINLIEKVIENATVALISPRNIN